MVDAEVDKYFQKAAEHAAENCAVRSFCSRNFIAVNNVKNLVQLFQHLSFKWRNH